MPIVGYPAPFFPGSSLTDATVTYGPNTYTVESVQLTGSDETSLSVRFSQAPTEEEVDTWILDVDGREYFPSDSTTPPDSDPDRTFLWENSGLSWSDGEAVSLALKVLNQPVQGRPGISGTRKFGETLTADTSGITDPDGVPGDVVFTYQWFTADLGGAETDIPSAIGPSYTIPRDMEDDLLGVRVGFTDSHGFDESVASHEVVWRRVGEIWAALLTAKNRELITSLRRVGFGSRYPGSSLSDRTFTYRSNTYQVDSLQDEDTSAGTSHFFLSFNQKVVQREAETWAFVADGSERSLPDANISVGTPLRSFKWGRAFGWSDGDVIRVSIRLVNALAEGRPTIAGVPRVERTLTADTSAITDVNGVPEDVVFTYQWIVDDADVPEATGPSYTVQPSDLGLTIKVRIGFTDSDGYEETVTSDVTAPVEARSKAVNFWTATVTVKQSATSAGTIGYHVVDTKHPGSGITEGNVTFGASSYEVRSVLLTDGETLKFTLSPPPSGEEIELWILDTTLRELRLADADLVKSSAPGIPTTAEFIWDGQGDQAWSDGDMVQLSLKAPNRRARGVAITGEPETGGTLTADISGLTDPDGVPDGVVYTYQWIDSDGDNDADIDGAMEDTYTVTGDEGGLVKVRVGFTDARGFSESVTSEGVITPKRGEVLWALLRAAQHTNDSDSIGHGSFYQGSFLSESAFTLAGQDYSVRVVAVSPSGLKIELEPLLSSEEVANRLTLSVGSKEFRFSDRSTRLSHLSLNDSFSLVVWEDPDLSWSAGDKIRIGLSATTDAQDEPPIVLASATVAADGASIELVFDEPYDVESFGQFTASPFTVTADGNSVTIGQIASVRDADLEYRTIRFENLTPAITAGQVVVVTYTDPTAGDDAANFTTGSDGVPAVVNNVPEPNTPPATNAAPVFTSDAAFSADENQTAVGTVMATDADSGDTVTYAVTGGDDQTQLQIESASGVLTFAAAPDHENPADDGGNNEYIIVVTATGGTGARALTTDQAITVTVNDVDETPAVASVDVTSTPSATTDTYGLDETIEVTVTFDLAVTVTGTPRIQLRIGGGAQGNLKWANYASGTGTTALRFTYVVQAGDQDDNGIYIEANELFLNGGTIQGVDDDVAAGLTYALLGTQSGHKVDGSLTTTGATNTAPVFTSAATFSADENQTAVGTVMATDADSGDTVTYAITGGADQARFRIDPASGALTFATAPDHEDPTDAGTNNVYLVTVTATGGTGARALTTDQAITVTVNDVDETPAVASVEVSSTPSAATDTYGLDETIEVTVTFDQAVTVTGTPRIQLRIGGGAQGNLKWANYAGGTGTTALRFTYVVQAGDMDDNGIYIEADELFLNGGTIQGVDDNVAAGLTYALLGTQSGHKVDGSIAGTTPSTNAAPVFTSDATFSADENQTAVGTVIATDADAGDAVSYAVTGGADQARFRIDPTSGALTFATAPDHENPTDADSNNVYLVTVTATGGTGARALTTEQAIAVTVNDVDETAGTPATGDLTATVGTGKIRLEWTGSADAYEYRRKEEGRAWSAWTAAGTGGWFVLRNATTLDDYDVLAETTYTYQVREAGASDALGEAQGRLGPPITLRLDRTAYSVDEGAGELFFTVLAEAPAGWDRYDRDIRPSLTSAGVPGPLPESPSERPFSKTQEDYERFAESLIIEPGEFVMDNGRYVASRGRSIGIVDDTLVEEDETFELRLLLAGGVSRFFTLGVGKGQAEVTIVDNDTDSAPAAGNPLTGFELVDATAHLEAGAVEDGATLTDIDPDKVYGFRANVEPGSDLQSVKLELRGPGESDIATRTANDKPYSLYGDSGGHEHGATLAPGSYTLTATAHSEPGGGGSQLGTLSVEFTVAGEPLTVKFEGLPRGGHAGAGTTFTVRLSFSEAVSITPEALGQALEVTNATVGAVSRVDGRSDLWEVRLTPESDATVTVALSPAADCDAAEAVCTTDGRMLAHAIGTAIPGPLPNSQATGLPTISGVAEVGQVLSADATGIDDDNGLDNAEFSYQWLRSDGGAYTDIQDATESTYTLVADDEGRTIKVKVSFTDDEGNAESLTSDPTGEVEAAETVPGRPQDLEGEASAQGIELTWEAPPDSAVTSYVIYRAVLEDGQLHGKPMTKHATIEATGADMAYTDSDAEAGVEYRYRVAAVNSAGEGKKSNWINIFAGDS